MATKRELAEPSVHLMRVANKLRGPAQKLSVADRFRRFLNHRHVCVCAWYHPVAAALLCEAAHPTGVLRLLIDCSKLGHGHPLLRVSLGYRRRALPLAWTWVRTSRGHSAGHKPCALLADGQSLVAPDTQVIVRGDSEFTPLLALVARWHWFSVLRQQGRHLWRQSATAPWHRCVGLVTQPGQQRWRTDSQLTQEPPHRSPCLALWQTGAKKPWLLPTPICRPHVQPVCITPGACGRKTGSLISNAMTLLSKPRTYRISSLSPG